ncbi:MAG: DUF1015 domain-containing protein [Clostridia bacterium]|nr:DUF1015 domain-containing protein [Clostridia bacterium]
MAEIRPIYALHYTEKAGNIADCVCPPYDIIPPSEREELIAKNEYNLVRLELPVGEDRYAEAGKLLDKWLDEGILVQDERPSLFVYRELFSVNGKNYVLTGAVCRVKLCDFSEKVVLPHEETLKKAKADRFELMCATGCNFSSVYSLYNDDGSAAKVINAITAADPIYDFTDDEKVTHRVWKTGDESLINDFAKALADKQLFIADGHHRYETALNYRDHLIKTKGSAGDADSIMMTVVAMDDPGLVVFPTHRMIVDMPVNEKEVAKICGDRFDCRKAGVKGIEKLLAANSAGHIFALYTGGDECMVMRLKPEAEGELIDGRSEAYSDLDVSVLHKYILEEALGIDKENMANQVNLRYTRSLDEALESVNGGKATAAFIINPTKVSQIKAVALAGDKMPQKSTYFYPKLKTGMIMNRFKEIK